MTIVETVWMVALGVAVLCAAVDVFVAWLDGAVVGANWHRAVGFIVSQWLALFSMALILSLALRGRG